MASCCFNQQEKCLFFQFQMIWIRFGQSKPLIFTETYTPRGGVLFNGEADTKSVADTVLHLTWMGLK